MSKNFLTKHLRDINESYFVHMGHALGFARDSLIAFFCFFTHSILPFIFLTTGSSTTKKLLNRINFRTKLINLATTNEKHVAIVGFGMSGLIAFYNLVKNYPASSGKLVVRIFEKSPSLVKGTAYSTKNPNHLLNVLASRMGVVEEDVEHFFKWLCRKGYSYQKTDFVPRQIFGIYLEDILQSALKIAEEKNIFCEFRSKEISEITERGNYFWIDGDLHHSCILAVGPQLKDSKKSFWRNDLENYLSDEEIHILGCGLTAIDAVISLRDLKYSGKIFLHSRRGILSKPHKIFDSQEKVESPLSLEDSDLTLSQIFRKFVNACKKAPDWRLAFDAFRPHTQKFWMALNAEKKKRFLRHCFRLWNVHRHRCPESQFRVVEEMIKSGKLRIEKGRVTDKKLIDCTGFDYGFESELIKNLVKNNLVKFDEIHSGIIPQRENFYVTAGLNFGSLFEITAAPDISLHCKRIVDKIILSLHS
ncbi:MAG: FAD/NAD(P)-binding protein [Proteobacteria bacterium]|nr:FAD/NAD(P)-binding protein [Pseudomonadota bacterium]